MRSSINWNRRKCFVPFGGYFEVSEFGILGEVVAGTKTSFERLNVESILYLLTSREHPQGLWTGGQQSVEQAYLAFAAKPGERTELTSRLGTFAVLGFILGPAFGAMFTTVNFRIDMLNLTVDPYTAPGIFILFIGFAMFIATYTRFRPSAVSGREMTGHSSKSSLEALNGSVDGDSETAGLLGGGTKSSCS